jgi:hypothetical protein
VSVHHTIRTHGAGWGKSHLKSWLVETSAGRESWRQVAREGCRLIRLVNIGRNHWRSDGRLISAWETFGSLIE